MRAIDRRGVMQSVLGAMLGGVALSLPADAAAVIDTEGGKVTGKGPGDFDFLTGEWTIRHRKFDTSGPNGKVERRGGATVRRVLGGAASIEELRDGEGKMFGMGVRVWRPEEKVWADHWTGASDGVVNPPQLGRFIDGAGVFLADDEMDGKPIKVRAVWDKITPTSCRWYQVMSRNGGKDWDYGWYMDWTRVG